MGAPAREDAPPGLSSDVGKELTKALSQLLDHQRQVQSRLADLEHVLADIEYETFARESVTDENRKAVALQHAAREAKLQQQLLQAEEALSSAVSRKEEELANLRADLQRKQIEVDTLATKFEQSEKTLCAMEQQLQQQSRELVELRRQYELLNNELEIERAKSPQWAARDAEHQERISLLQSTLDTELVARRRLEEELEATRRQCRALEEEVERQTQRSHRLREELDVERDRNRSLQEDLSRERSRGNTQKSESAPLIADGSASPSNNASGTTRRWRCCLLF